LGLGLFFPTYNVLCACLWQNKSCAILGLGVLGIRVESPWFQL